MNLYIIAYIASLSANNVTLVERLKQQVTAMRMWADGEEDQELIWKKTHRLLKKYNIDELDL